MDNSTIFYGMLAAFLSILIALFHYHTVFKKKKGYYLWLAILLRFLSAFCILLLLFNPKYNKYYTYLEKPTLAVAIDNSSSISFLKQKQKAQDFISFLKKSKGLDERFEVSYYTFGNKVNTGSNPDFLESQTKISSAFNSIQKLNKDKPSATILISDGNQTFGRDYSFQKANPLHKIYPVLLGDTLKILDLKITQINSNRYAFSGNSFPVELFLNYQGTKPIKSKLSLYNGNTLVFSESINFEASSETIIKTINLTAKSPGTQVYRAELAPLSDEQNKINNKKEFAVEIIDQRTEILVVSDLVHPDLGAIKKSIESNEQRLVTFAKSNVSQNLLDESELVILYQPTPSFSSLFKKLTSQNRNYFIITGTRTDWNFINTVQDHFKKDWIRQTEEIQGEKNNGYDVFNIENVSFVNYPPLEAYLGDLTFSVPTAPILFNRIRNLTLTSPLLVTFEKDNNKFGLLNGENIWKWRAHNFVLQNSFEDFDSFFGKLVFYLSSDKKRERLSLTYEPFYDGSNNLRIAASYFNKNYEFDAGANLLLSLTNKNSNESRKIPLILKGNYYEADISTIPSGPYEFEVKVLGQNMAKSGNFRILDFDIEKQFLTADKQRLQRLAENSGTQLIYHNQFDKLENLLLNDINYKPIQKNRQDIVSLIDFRYLLFAIAFLLALEWFLRKYKGLI
ncbi:vWA domain-containing protein [Ascidiimonas sp. W6]|uniref:vWA domain-containing protein n=1 Tax=Ascidiimonas meishanensis TaxID=3128903 RepID=UPI0030EB1DE8